MTVIVSITAQDYEKRLDADLTWALREGSMFFNGNSEVQAALRRITGRLNALGIDYAVVGGMALYIHGLRRFTEDVDILVTREGLRQVHQALVGSGYRPPFPHSKNLRDTENGVRIEFVIAGEYPGDGKAKPVSFPEPKLVATEQDEVRLLTLPAIIELKLASGMTGADRLKDLADVQELIKWFRLPANLADQLNGYVRDKYGELWQGVNGASKRYVRVLDVPPMTQPIASLADAISVLPASLAASLAEMQAEGIVLDTQHSRPQEGYLMLMIMDAQTAQRHEFNDEAEYWNEG